MSNRDAVRPGRGSCPGKLTVRTTSGYYSAGIQPPFWQDMRTFPMGVFCASVFVSPHGLPVEFASDIRNVAIALPSS